MGKRIPVVTQVADLLGSAVQGLASWIGLDRQLSDWLKESKDVDKIHARLEKAINKKIAEHQFTMDEILNKMNELGVQGLNITGDTAIKVGQAKAKKKSVLSNQYKKEALKQLDAQLDLNQNDRALLEGEKLTHTGQINAESQFYDLANKYNI